MYASARNLSRVVLRASLILAINISLAAAYCYAVQYDRHPKRWHTAGTLFLIGNDEHHDTIILGSSRIFYFSRCRGAHERLEASLNRPVLNLSTPAAGILLTKMHMEQYWARGNTCDRILYFADVPYFYSRYGNERLPVLEEQPWSATFLIRLIANGVEPASVLLYVRSKFSLEWMVFEPLNHTCGDMLPEGDARNLERATQRHHARTIPDTFYDAGVSGKRLNRYMGLLEEFIRTAQKNGAKLTIVLPPVLVTAEPGENTFKQAIHSLTGNVGVPCHDYSRVIEDPSLFSDINHLNERGVAHFARYFMAPLLDAPL